MTSAVAGMITLAAYAVYAVTVVPFVEKQSPESRVGTKTGRKSEAGPAPADDRFAQWFPERDAWERENPLVIETPSAILVFDEYKNIRGGTVRLTPCSVIMLPGDSQTDPQRRIQEAVVLRAPEGANLRFDREFDVRKGSVGELIGGELLGDVTIRGAGKKPTPDDDLFLSTRNISMHGDVISTAEDVAFRWGKNHGQGKDLSIALLPEEDGQREASRFAGLATLEMRHNVSLHLVLSNDDEQTPVNSLQLRPSQSPDNPFPFSKDTPLDINCGGAFRFDFIDLEASFNDGVIVERPIPEGGLDTLHCERLTIGFRAMDENEETNGEQPTRAFARMEVKRLDATGSPAVLKAPSRQAYAEGARLAYNFLTGGVELGSAERDAEAEVHFRHEGNELRARNLEYEPGQNGRIGQFLAQGPGWLDWEMRDDNQTEKRRFRASWSSRLHSRPIDGLQIISIEGNAVVNVTAMGRIAADQIHAWIYEDMPEPGALTPEGTELKPELIPKRMLAVMEPGQGSADVSPDGAVTQSLGVSFQSAELTGRTERLEAWFVGPGGLNRGDPIAAPRLRRLHPQPGRPSVLLATAPTGGVWHTTAFRGQQRPANSDNRYQDGRRANPLPWQTGPSHGGSLPGQPLRAVEQANPGELALRSPSLVSQIGTAPLLPIQPPVDGPSSAGHRNHPPSGLLPSLSAQRRFDVEGKTIQVQLIQLDKTAEVSQVTVHKNAILRETKTEKPDDLPLLVRGDVLHMQDAHLPTSLVTVAGGSAHIEGRGLSLTANRINLDRGRNRLWIDEPGLMTLLVDRDLQGNEIREPMPLEITWRNRFEFDGVRAIFDSGVVARREHEQLQTELLEVVMTKRVDFGESKLRRSPERDRPEIAQFICREGVYLEAHRYDNHGDLESIEKMQLVDLSIDQQSGALSGGGPGWITRVARSDSRGEVGLPGAVRPPVARSNRRDEEPRTLYLRVDFQQGMTGNIHRRQVIFQHQVVCVYGEISDWNQTIDGERPSEFSQKTVRLRSDQLQVTEMPAAAGAPAWRELVASGNTTSEGKMFTANAERITYTESQQLLVMEGNSVRPAEFYLQKRVGDRPTRIAARKVKYNSKTGEYSLDGADSLDLIVPPRGSGGRQ
ncbi:MAG: LptA/OstA family protein [Pirellulales bacterium]|nr:LptA/OstA family protein [Pirellulales bacterium]